MAIKFEFVLSDVDAINLMEIVNSAKLKSMDRMAECLACSEPSLAALYKRDVEYIKSLIKILTEGSCRVDSVVL